MIFHIGSKNLFHDDTDSESDCGASTSSVGASTRKEEDNNFVLELSRNLQPPPSTKKLARVRVHTMIKVFYDLEKALLQLVKESSSLSPDSNIFVEEDALVAMMVLPKTNKHYRNSKSDTPAFVLKRLKRKYIIETIDGFLNLKNVIKK
jgi:hypothetical protein